MTAGRRAVTIVANAFYWNGRDEIRHTVNLLGDGRVRYHTLPAKRLQRNSAVAVSTCSPEEMQDWGAIALSFQQATSMLDRLHASTARLTTPQEAWLRQAFPLGTRRVADAPPVTEVRSEDTPTVERLIERGIVAPIATPRAQPRRVQLTATKGLPLVRRLFDFSPLHDF